MGTIDSLKNSFNNSTTGRLLMDENGYNSTPYKTEFIPEYLMTTGQKRFSTTASIPNLPKPESLYFVHFSLNKDAQAMINKKKSLINFLVHGNANVNNSAKSNSLADSIVNKVKKTAETATEELKTSALSLFGKKFSKKFNDEHKKDNSILPIVDCKTFGDYMPDKYLLSQLSFELSKFVKSINKPSIDFSVKEYNEYNRKRLAYEKMSFSPLKISFYDVKDNPIQQFFFAYLKMISNDFLCKDFNDFNKEILTNKFDHSITDWGFSTDSNFRLIDKISLCEFYMDKLMVYTYERPVLKSIDFGSNKAGSFNPNEVEIVFEYEGFTNDLLDTHAFNVDLGANKAYLKSMINANITPEVATFLNMRYKSGSAMGIDTSVSFIKGILDAPKEERWDKFKSQSLDTLRQLGFAEEIEIVKRAENDYENYKNSDNKGQFLLKATDDPSSTIGQLISGGSSSVTSGFVKTFF